MYSLTCDADIMTKITEDTQDYTNSKSAKITLTEVQCACAVPFLVFMRKKQTTKYGGIYDVISVKFRLGRGNRSLSGRGRSAGGWQGTVYLGYLQPYAGQNKER